MSTKRVDDAEPAEREVATDHASLKVLLRVLNEAYPIYPADREPLVLGWVQQASHYLTLQEYLFALEEAEPEGERLSKIEECLRWAVKTGLSKHHIILREGEG